MLDNVILRSRRNDQLMAPDLHALKGRCEPPLRELRSGSRSACGRPLTPLRPGALARLGNGAEASLPIDSRLPEVAGRGAVSSGSGHFNWLS